MKFDYSEGVDIFAPDGRGHIATLCNHHAKEAGYDLESEHVMPIMAIDEMDSYSCCEVHECGEVFSYVSLTNEGREWLEGVREEEIARLKGMRTGEVIKWFTSCERAWIFGWNGFDLAYGLARKGKIEEAIEALEDLEDS